MAGEGQQLGVAKGRIEIDAKDAERIVGILQKAGNRGGRALDNIDASAKKASNSLGILTKVVGSVGAVMGVQFGMQSINQLLRWVDASAKIAVQYERQSVAARSLAGSQENLNRLMVAYNEATKGTVDQAQALADVTQLQAIGFADSAEELTRFVEAARGISIATGRNQDYVISQLQLAIANQSVMRLDQIGLGVSEVKAKIDELRKANAQLTDEMAYQDAVLGLAEEKFGALNDALEAQATGAEKASAAFKDLRLSIGAAAQEATNDEWQLLADILGVIGDAGGTDIDINIIDKARQSQYGVGSPLPGGLGSFANIQAQSAGRFLEGQEGNAIDRLINTMIERMPGGGGAFQSGEVSLMLEFSELLQSEHGLIRTLVEKQLSEYEEVGGVAGLIETFQRYALGQNTPGVGANSFYNAGGVYNQTNVGAIATNGIGNRTEDQREIIINHYRQLESIEKAASESRIAEQKSFYARMADINRAYHLSQTREAEDFTLNRSRTLAAHAKSLADIEEQAREQEEDIREGNGKRLDSLREAHEERINDLTENYHKARERAEKNHRENLLGAAANLDAAAVASEQRRFALETKDRDENHRDSLKKQNEAYDKAVKEQQEALQEQLEQTRKADQDRREQLEEDLAERLRIEDEDRAIKLRRQREDYEKQLADLKKSHDDRVTEINDQERLEKEKRTDEFQARLDQAGLAHEKWLEEQKKWEDAALESFEKWFEDIDNTIKGKPTSNRDRGDPDSGREYADGGPVNRTGSALVHAGEFVLNPRTTGTLRGMMGNFSQRDILQAVGGRNISLASGAIQVYGAAGQSEERLAQLVRDQLMAAFQAAA